MGLQTREPSDTSGFPRWNEPSRLGLQTEAWPSNPPGIRRGPVLSRLGLQTKDTIAFYVHGIVRDSVGCTWDERLGIVASSPGRFWPRLASCLPGMRHTPHSWTATERPLVACEPGSRPPCCKLSGIGASAHPAYTNPDIPHSASGQHPWQPPPSGRLPGYVWGFESCVIRGRNN